MEHIDTRALLDLADEQLEHGEPLHRAIAEAVAELTAARERIAELQCELATALERATEAYHAVDLATVQVLTAQEERDRAVEARLEIETEHAAAVAAIRACLARAEERGTPTNPYAVLDVEMLRDAVEGRR